MGESSGPSEEVGRYRTSATRGPKTLTTLRRSEDPGVVGTQTLRTNKNLYGADDGRAKKLHFLRSATARTRKENPGGRVDASSPIAIRQ